MASLELRAVSLTFSPRITALEDISVTLRSGEYTLIVGANGAGKSALLRVASRLVAPTSGTLEVSLSAARWKESDFRRSVRMVTQHPGSHLLGQTVREDLQISARTAHLPPESAEAEASRFSLTPLLDRPIHALSGGEQRRVALAGALMGEPELLLFDEPFLELDYPSTLEFLSIRRELSRRGVGIVIATHDYHRTAAEADRMLILESGRLVVDAPPREAIASAGRYSLRPANAPLEQLLWGVEEEG